MLSGYFWVLLASPPGVAITMVVVVVVDDTKLCVTVWSIGGSRAVVR